MHHKLIVNRKASNTDALKMFTVLTHTTLPSLQKILQWFYIYSRKSFHECSDDIGLGHINAEDEDDFLLAASQV